MPGSLRSTARYVGRWLVVGVVLAAVVVGVIVIATQSGSIKTPPVSVVLERATLHSDATDGVLASNRSGYEVSLTGCGDEFAQTMRRTGAAFKPPSGLQCADAIPIAPHSVHRFRPLLPMRPGKYWVYFLYDSDSKSPWHGQEYAAYAKLSVRQH